MQRTDEDWVGVAQLSQVAGLRRLTTILDPFRENSSVNERLDGSISCAIDPVLLPGNVPRRLDSSQRLKQRISNSNSVSLTCE